MKKVRKALVALAGVLAVISAGLADDGDLSGDEVLNIGIAIVTAIGVYLAKNEKEDGAA